MLVQFSVENFLSFYHPVVFSMTASSDMSHPSHLINVEGLRRSPLLRGAALYGANGAGKSNLLKAVAFARNLIVEGTRPERLIPINTFRLKNCERPSRLQFHFIVNDRLYDYGFVIDSRKVHEEWLYATSLEKGAREQKLFERATTDNETHIDFGDALTGKRLRDKRQYEFVSHGTRINQLFLTEAIERNMEQMAPVWRWFKETLLVLPADAVANNLPVVAHHRSDVTQFISAFLRKVDKGIRNVSTVQRPVDFDRDFDGLEASERVKLKQDCQTVIEETSFALETNRGTRYVLCHPEREPMLVRFVIHYKSSMDNEALFEFEELSEGTQRIINLLPLLELTYSSGARVILLDELDRRLHTHLSQAFVQAALGVENSSSQFIFTTHDTNLLDLELLRRDEIWFVEKDKGGASDLYSLVEFKVRPDLQIEKGYLNGRFGAIPFLGDLSRIGLEAEKAS